VADAAMKAVSAYPSASFYNSVTKISLFESGKQAKKKLPKQDAAKKPRSLLDDVPLLSEIYRADVAVMLSFFQTPVDIQVKLTDIDFRDQGENKIAIPGTHKATYFFPANRLRNSNSMLVMLKLEPGGHSPKVEHRHAGDEIIRVLEGSVVLTMPDQAREFTRALDAGDVAHFDADNCHYVENRSDKPAKVFIARDLTF
jgi:quercetin dioxygenase-like cupin family protein